MTENVITQAKSDAMQWQVDARNRNDDSPLAPEDLYREAARRMSRVPWNFGGGPVSIRLRSRCDHCSRFRQFRRRHAFRALLGG